MSHWDNKQLEFKQTQEFTIRCPVAFPIDWMPPKRYDAHEIILIFIEKHESLLGLS